MSANSQCYFVCCMGRVVSLYVDRECAQCFSTERYDGPCAEFYLFVLPPNRKGLVLTYHFELRVCVDLFKYNRFFLYVSTIVRVGDWSQMTIEVIWSRKYTICRRCECKRDSEEILPELLVGNNETVHMLKTERDRLG